MVVAASWWNKGAGGSSPSRRCLWRFRRAARLSAQGRRGEGGDLALEFLSPVLAFVMVRSAPASRWRCWGLCGGAPVLGVWRICCMYMSFDRRLSPCATTAVCEKCCCSRIWAGGQTVLADPAFRPRRCRRPAAVPGLEEHGVVPRSTCHRDFGSSGGGPLIRLTKPFVAMVLPQVLRRRRAWIAAAGRPLGFVVISASLRGFSAIFPGCVASLVSSRGFRVCALYFVSG